MACLVTFACQKPDGMLPASKILDIGAVACYMIGDYYYNDSAGNLALNGVSLTQTVLRGANNTFATNYSRFHNFYGRAGLSTYAQLWAAHDARKIRIYSMPDDHDGCWNNNDHTLAVFGTNASATELGAYNFWAGTCNDTTLNTQADVLTQWRLGQSVLKQIQADYFDNVWGAPNGDIPSAMVGFATAADYVKKYFFHDYDKDLNLVPDGAPNAVLRVIVPDCISYKNPASQTDNASKTLLGATQKRWVKASALAAKDYKCGVTFLWTKDLMNQDNGDGFCGYKTERDELLSYFHTNNIPVDHITGDRHNPHASICRTANGDAYDATVVCACPSGQGTGGLTQYKQNVWSYTTNDACVVGSLELDFVNNVKLLSIMDAFTMTPLYQVAVPFGSRLPSRISATKWARVDPMQAANVLTYSSGAGPLQWPASTAKYTNNSTGIQQVTIVGTLTNVVLSRDGNVTTDTIATTTGGVFMLAPGDSLSPTYSALTTFKVSNLPLR